MQKVIIFFIFSCLSTFTYCQILGKVNGRNCLELKDSRGCCQVGQTDDGYGHSIIECPWSTPNYVCKKDNQCVPGITNSCRSGWGEVWEVNHLKDVGCIQPYWTTFLEERKQGVRKMNEWCASQGGKLATVTNFMCECENNQKIINSIIYKAVCKKYKRFENK